MVVATTMFVVSNDQHRALERGRRLDHAVNIRDELFARPDIVGWVLIVLFRAAVGWFQKRIAGQITRIALCLFLLVPATALAGDLTVTLDTGGGFVIKDNTGTIELLRVDDISPDYSRRIGPLS